MYEPTSKEELGTRFLSLASDFFQVATFCLSVTAGYEYGQGCTDQGHWYLGLAIASYFLKLVIDAGNRGKGGEVQETRVYELREGERI